MTPGLSWVLVFLVAGALTAFALAGMWAFDELARRFRAQADVRAIRRARRQRVGAR